MVKRGFVVWIIATAGIVVVMLPSATYGARRISYLCLEDIIRIREFPFDRVHIGCEVIDCCPGCPGPGPLDVRIQVTGDLVESVVLHFENLPDKAREKVRIKGKSKWLDRNLLKIGKGETILGDMAVSRKMRPTVVIPHLSVNKNLADKLLMSQKRKTARSGKESGKVVLTIEQLLGRVVVNRYTGVYLVDHCWPFPVAPKTDWIDLRNNEGNDNAVVLLDGKRSFWCMNDEIWRGAGLIEVGNVLSRGNCNCETVVFSDDDAMQLVENVNLWTDSTGDKQVIELTPGPLRIPVTIWVLHGPFATIQNKVSADMARANQLYNTMNCGIAFQTTAVHDATGDPDTPRLLDAGCGNAADLRADIGVANNNLNVYYVRNAANARGWWCGNDTVIIGSTADNETLAHEMGHALTLGHTNTVAGIPSTNLMETGGIGRNSITEGQCFRCNVNTGSAVNRFGLRTGPTRNCPDSTASKKCPELKLDVTPN